MSTQSLYQQNRLLDEYPLQKKLLQQFYLNLLHSQLSSQNSPIAIRGYISLNESSAVYTNHHLIDEHLNNEKLDKGIKMSLHIALFLKSKKLEKEYISLIISTLNKEQNADLNTLFFGAIAGHLGRQGIHSISQESKIVIKPLLTNFLQNLTLKKDKSYNGYIYPQSKGLALEALALVSSDSLKDAAKFIANYLNPLSSRSQEEFIVCFSNNAYMQQAFNEDRILINIRTNNLQLYNNTIGLPKR